MAVPHSNTGCPRCGKAVLRTDAKYCSLACSSESQRVLRCCVICGAVFRPRHGNLACSQRCGWQLLSRNASLRRERRRLDASARLVGLVPFMLAVYRLDCERKRARLCRICGQRFVSRFGQERLCSPACRRERRRQHKRQVRRRSGRTKTGSHKARALARGARYERINRLAVFARDGWRCWLCGCRTPKRLLRSYKDPSAPTLDHIIPISAGGGHLWSNVQCACRQCNSIKSGKPLGQQRLL